jgi:D-galactarolactone cycloisomerase
MPNGTFVEAFTPQRDPIFWNLLVNRKPLQDGQLPLPDGPGLGWALDDDFIRRYRADT